LQRRDLLKLAMANACGTTMGLHNLPLLASTLTGRRIVLVELAGANDGLNTLVPIKDDNYRKLRPTLALPSKEVIDLQDDHALHRGLAPLMDSWEKGELSWVQGLGYPAPNRSHFKSIALWESGGDGLKDGRSGWLTHDIEHSLKRRVLDAHGISLVSDMSLFDSSSGRWLSLSSPEQFQIDRRQTNTSSAKVNDSIALVANAMQDLDASLARLQVQLANAPAAPKLEGGRLGNQLRQVLQFIRAGIDTPVYRVQLSGFDTHENQLGRHAKLLSQLGESLASFRRALIDDGEWDNTIVMTYSEFGRRAAQNRSGGTDHGTAAPHLLYNRLSKPI